VEFFAKRVVKIKLAEAESREMHGLGDEERIALIQR